MDIIPILQTFRQKKGLLFLTTLQLAVTLAVIANTVVTISAYQNKVNYVTGIDDTKIVSINIQPYENSYFDDEGTSKIDIEQDLIQLRSIEGVLNVSHTTSIPLDGRGRLRGTWPLGNDKEIATRHSIYSADGEFINALGLNLLSGRQFTQEEINWYGDPLSASRPPVVIVSQALADQLFPEKNALGQQVESDNGTVETIIGIVEKLPGRHILMNSIDQSAIVPGRPSSSMQYLIKTNGSMTPQVVNAIDAALRRINNEREINVEVLEKLKTQSMHFLYLFSTILGFISGLLLLVTAIGAYSQASYSVAKRTKEIGTRRAFGATKAKILSYFLLENWLVTTIGVLVGLLFANGLNFILAMALQTPRVNLEQLAYGVAFLWLVGLLSTFLPAYKAASIPPAIATRSAQ